MTTFAITQENFQFLVNIPDMDFFVRNEGLISRILRANSHAVRLFRSILSWHLPNKKTGESKLGLKFMRLRCLVKRYEDFAEELGISISQVQRGLQLLKQVGLIYWRVGKQEDKNTCHFFLRNKFWGTLTDFAWTKIRTHFSRKKSNVIKENEKKPNDSTELSYSIVSETSACDDSLGTSACDDSLSSVSLTESTVIPPTPTSGGGTVCFTHAENGEGEQGLETEGEEVEFLADSRDDIEEPVSEPPPPPRIEATRTGTRDGLMHKAGNVLGRLFSKQGATAEARRAIPPSPTHSPSSPPRYGTRASGTNQRALGTNPRTILAREGEEVLRLAKERYQREQEELLRLAGKKPPGGETDSFAAEVKGLPFSKMFEVAKARIAQQKQKKGA